MQVISPSTRKLLEIFFLKGVGAAKLRPLKNTSDFNTCSDNQIVSLSKGLAKFLSNPALKLDAEELTRKQIDLAEQAGVRILSFFDDEYPKLLKDSCDDPCIIWVKGHLPVDSEKALAVIGTREPTVHGKIIANRIASHFASEGWSIVSGLALGCDTEAHKAALSVRGHTIAVLAHGLQTILPVENASLAQEIIEAGGALISEFPLGQAPLPGLYVKRDKTQAALSQGVILIQSACPDFTNPKAKLPGSLNACRATLASQRWLAVAIATEKDKANNEVNVQANVVLTSGTDEEKTQLLDCDDQALHRVIVLHGKDDYSKIHI